MNKTPAHTFYKEFFDKPERIKQRILVPTEKLDIPIEDFYRQTAKAKRIFSSPKREKQVKYIVRPQALESVSRPGTSQKTFRTTQTSLKQSQQNFFVQDSGPSLKTLTIKEFSWNQNFNSRDWSRPAQFMPNQKKLDLQDRDIRPGT